MLDDFKKAAGEKSPEKTNAEIEREAHRSNDAAIRKEFPFVPLGVTLGQALGMLWTIVERDNHPTLNSMIEIARKGNGTTATGEPAEKV